jgi:hypothetical protein
MPRYDYVIERFKRYDAWQSVSHTQTEHTFRPVWSSTRFAYRNGWVAAMLILIGLFLWVYRQFPAERVKEITLEEFGTYLRQHRETGLPLSATACPEGIIGEIDNEQIYWVELGYSGSRWTATYDLPESVWAERCTPPIFLQAQRLQLMLTATALLTLVYIAFNAFVMYQRWKPIQPITVREHGETVIISENGQELNPATYEQLDKRFKLRTDNIRPRKVVFAAIGFAIVGIFLSLLAAYII